MNENKKRHYPKDRAKLHTLLDKREKELQAMQAEVDEIRALVKEADSAAINATAEAYNVTPEQFAEIMQALRKERKQVVPALPENVKPLSENTAIPAEEDDSVDNEYA